MKIAIVKLSALGDIIHTMVVLQFIKKQYPDALIDWVVEKSFKGILDNNPDIHQIFAINLKKAKQQKSLILLYKELRRIKQFGQSKQYDLVIDAQGLLKSAIVAKLLKTKKIAGFDKNSIRERFASWFYNKKVSIAYDKNTIDRNIAVTCQPLGIKTSYYDVIDKKVFLFANHHMQYSDKSYIVFIIGSTWKNRNYPKEKFVELADSLSIECLVPWGADDEKNDANWMSSQSHFIKVLPKLTLDKLKSVINGAVMVIGNDTGPTHIAWGLNKPSITIFGPTPITRVYQTPINKVISSNSKVNSFKLNKNDDSIKTIAVADIIKITKNILQENGKDEIIAHH